MAELKTCSLCGGNYRDWATHFASRRHQRAMHPAGSRKSSRANARRERARVARHQLTRRYEDDMYAAQERDERRERQESGRHFYGSWTPFGVTKFMGGHPGHALKRAHRHIRRVLSSKPRASDDE